MKEATTTLFRAAAVRDAAPSPQGPVDFRPGTVAVREGRIVAVGEPDHVEKEAKHHGPVRRVDLPDRLILPAMVNAHAHLDLTDIGPIPYENAGRDFIKWIEMVMKLRPRTHEAITAAVRRGLRMSREAGVGAIGDIAGSEAAVRARIDEGEGWTDGPSFLECFGLGPRASMAATEAIQRFESLAKLSVSRRGFDAMRIGLEPHAPYSAGAELFAAVSLVVDCARTTHLAETREEETFVHDAEGPFVDLLRRLAKWDGSFVATDQTPVGFLETHLKAAKWTVVHCNYVSDVDIELLKQAQASVAYCPIATEYFGHRNHRYRDMLDAGINVCLGTDSILCQPPDEPQPLGVFPQMRLLYQRDRFDPNALLLMATTRGWDAVGVPGEHNKLKGLQPGGPGRTRLIAIRIDPADPTDPLVQALLNDNLVEPLNIPKDEDAQ